jgi:hypothetical protein
MRLLVELLGEVVCNRLVFGLPASGNGKIASRMRHPISFDQLLILTNITP